jgi:hypothetical protein
LKLHEALRQAAQDIQRANMLMLQIEDSLYDKGVQQFTWQVGHFHGVVVQLMDDTTRIRDRLSDLGVMAERAEGLDIDVPAAVTATVTKYEDTQCK